MTKDVVGYEDLYSVTTEGVIISKRGSKPIEGYLNSKGYRIVTLSKNKKQTKYKVHRVVAQAFIPNPDELDSVDHIDENKENNKVDNLRWCTRGQNIQFYHKHINRVLEGTKLYGPKERPKYKPQYNQGKVYGTVEKMIEQTGKEIKINNTQFKSCGSAAAWITEQEALLGNTRNKATISKELRRCLQGKREEWIMYGKYSVSK